MKHYRVLFKFSRGASNLGFRRKSPLFAYRNFPLMIQGRRRSRDTLNNLTISIFTFFGALLDHALFVATFQGEVGLCDYADSFPNLVTP